MLGKRPTRYRQGHNVSHDHLWYCTDVLMNDSVVPSKGTKLQMSVFEHEAVAGKSAVHRSKWKDQPNLRNEKTSCVYSGTFGPGTFAVSMLPWVGIMK
jgi:hypothetical protein